MKQLLHVFILFFCINTIYSQTSPYVKLNGNRHLKLSKLKVHADISNQYAKVTYDMTFYNGKDRILEGELAFPLGQGQTVSHLSMDLNGYLRDAVIVKKELGRVAYENTIKQRIDPALLEQTKGNNYKVRVYPIPAKGYKRIVISYEQNLSVENENYQFEIPFDFKNKLDDFELEIIHNSRAIKPIVEGFYSNELNFRKSNGKFIAKFKGKNFNAVKNLDLKIPMSLDNNLLVNDDYFFVNLNIPSKSRHKATPKSITLLWDASYSMLYKNKNKEFQLLESYFKKIDNVKVDLIVFSNTIIQEKRYIIENGNWNTLKNELNNVVYDGGTSFQNLPINDTDEIILVSDGMHNLGDLCEKNINRFYAINSVKSANHEFLEKQANTFGGNYINLNKASPDASLNKLLNESYQFLGISKNNRLFEVFPKANEVVNGSFTIGGKRFNTDVVELLFGYNGKVSDTISVDFKLGTNSQLAKRLWSKRKLQSLSKSQEKNRDKIIEHAKENHLISSYTSMIVLDRIQDYVRYKIEPPKGLLPQYKRMITQNKQQEVSNAKILNRRRESLIDDYKSLLEWYTKDYSTKPVIKKDVKKSIAVSNSIEPDNTSSQNQQTFRSRPEFDDTKNNVSGIVFDSNSIPLPGVNVYVKGTARGVQTDFDGNYAMNVEIGETLVFSFVSMETVQFTLSNLSKLNVVMKDDAASLDEVVITGYSNFTKKTTTSAVTTINSEVIDNKSVLQSIQGQSPGLSIGKGSGQPGTNGFIILRGVGSINGNIEPLFIVDGIPVTQDNFRNIHQKNIKKISLLKNVAATAIYGSRGANGAIVIITTEGLENKNESIEALNSKIEKQSTLQPWQKKAPYLALLNEQGNIEDAYQLYLELRLKYSNTPSFFLDVAEYFESKDKYEYALRIATNLIEIEIDNHELIRALGYKLNQYKEDDLAVYVYKEVLNLRPEDPQSYRDLALAYEAIGEDKKAFDLFNKIVEGDLLEKDQANSYYGIEKIAYLELSNLVNKSDVLKRYRNVFPKIETDIRVVIDWNHANTDLDLHIKNPNGDELYYGKTESKFGDAISEDFTDGYGPETYKIKKAQKGKYEISVKYFSDSVQKITGPTSLKVTIFKNYGKPNQTKEIKILRLTDEEGKIKADTLSI